MEMRRIVIYDTTLRDGTQGSGINLSVEDKLKIARRLDDLGVDYIEGGWPGSNPKDMEFFTLAQQMTWKQSQIVAFGSTRRPYRRADADENLRLLLDAGTRTITIFGKSWDYHVQKALRTTLEENLSMIRESVAFLRQHDREVIYDAEHYFDGFKANRDYALATLRAAREGGAQVLVLCDTNGGTLPQEIRAIVEATRRELGDPVGIHTHNDAECAVANAIEAVLAGAVHVQGTINGYGERCGNANLCSVIPALRLKLGLDCLHDGALAQLTDVSHFVAEVANCTPFERQPYVGRNAFAHKAGVHVSAVMAAPDTYEHIPPEVVGNRRRVIVSDLSGRANILYKASEIGLDLSRDSPEVRTILERIKWMEHAGYQFEGAEASFELLARRLMGGHRPPFEVGSFRVVVEWEPDGRCRAEATIRVRVGEVEEHTASDGNGPVHALDRALRKAIEKFYPEIREVRLVDYKVRVLNAEAATGARVRVLIETTDGRDRWGTVGVSENVVEASFFALSDSLEYALLRRLNCAAVP